MSAVDWFMKLKGYFGKLFQHGSILLAILIPLVLFLTQFDFITEAFAIRMTEIILWIGLAEVVFKLVLNKYLKAKAEIAKLNLSIKTDSIEILNQYAELDSSLKDELQKDITDLIGKISELAGKKVESKNESESIQDTPSLKDTSVIEKPKEFTR